MAANKQKIEIEEAPAPPKANIRVSIFLYPREKELFEQILKSPEFKNATDFFRKQLVKFMKERKIDGWKDVYVG